LIVLIVWHVGSLEMINGSEPLLRYA
jgi:hypothetical protein